MIGEWVGSVIGVWAGLGAGWGWVIGVWAGLGDWGVGRVG
jgi:hypothetical protein